MMKIESYLNEALFFGIIRSGAWIGEKLSAQFKPMGINYVQALILISISREKLPVRPKQLQKAFGLSSGAISQSITHLERLKYLERKIAAKDARGYELHLTRLGRTHVHRLINLVESLERKIEKRIGAGKSKLILLGLNEACAEIE